MNALHKDDFTIQLLKNWVPGCLVDVCSILDEELNRFCSASEAGLVQGGLSVVGLGIDLGPPLDHHLKNCAKELGIIAGVLYQVVKGTRASVGHGIAVGPLLN